jgi:hypothetical protein
LRKIMSDSDVDRADMLPEYDLSGREGERGKYYRAYRDGHSVRVVQDDGTVDVRYFTLEDGAVILEPDVREYFPTSESVNEALRALISLVPSKPAKKTASGKVARRKLKI